MYYVPTCLIFKITMVLYQIVVFYYKSINNFSKYSSETSIIYELNLYFVHLFT